MNRLRDSKVLYLCEMVFLGILAVAVEALWEVVIAFPPPCPFVDAHDSVAMANRRIDFDRLAFHDLSPLHRMHSSSGVLIHICLDLRSQTRVIRQHFFLGCLRHLCFLRLIVEQRFGSFQLNRGKRRALHRQRQPTIRGQAADGVLSRPCFPQKILEQSL